MCKIWQKWIDGLVSVHERVLTDISTMGQLAVRPSIACGCRLLNNSDLAVVLDELAVLQIRYYSVVLFGKLGARVVGKNLQRFLLYCYFFDYCCIRLMTSFNIILGHGRSPKDCLQLPLPLRQLMQVPMS